MASLPNFLNHSWPTTRENVRKLADVPVQVTHGEHSFRGWCNDIGVGGMGITLAAPFHPGDHLEATFSLPDDLVVHSTTVVVRWSDGFRHGCEFLKLTMEISSAVSAYVARTEKPKPGRKK